MPGLIISRCLSDHLLSTAIGCCCCLLFLFACSRVNMFFCSVNRNHSRRRSGRHLEVHESDNDNMSLAQAVVCNVIVTQSQLASVRFFGVVNRSSVAEKVEVMLV